MTKTFDSWTKKELIMFLEGSIKSNNKLMAWLFQNHIKVLREYEDENLGGMRLHLLDSEKKQILEDKK